MSKKRSFTKAVKLNTATKQLRRWWWQACLVAAIIALGGFGWYQRAKSRQKPLKFISPTRQNLTKNLEVAGVIDADEKVRLRFLAGGKVTYLGAQEGDPVKRYQTIATIDQATLKKQLALDLNNYLIQREDWEQTRDEYVENGDGLTQPIAQVDDQRYVRKQQLLLDNSVLNVEIRNIAINNTRLSAPFSGILTHSPIKTAGGQLTATDYFEVVNPETLIFKAVVDEADIAQVKLGQTVQIVLDAYPNQTFDSQVEFINYTSDQTSDGSTVFVVKLPLTEASLDKLRLGMNGDAYIKLAEKSHVLTLPLDSLSKEDNQWYVQVKNSQGKLTKKAVQLGLMTDDFVEIVAGLNETDEVLLPES